MNDGFDLCLGSLTSKEAADILKSKGVSAKTSVKLQKIIHDLEDAVYSGREPGSCDPGKDLPGLIRQIEREVR